MSFVYDTEQREIIERLGRACDTIVQGFAGTSKTVLANGGGLHAAKNTVVINDKKQNINGNIGMLFSADNITTPEK